MGSQGTNFLIDNIQKWLNLKRRKG